MTYSEKLKDPRWQRKRLQVLNAADFCCQICGQNEEELHVHHNLYRRGAEPWDYEDYELRALCKSCHKHEEETRETFLSRLGVITTNYPLWDILNSLEIIEERGDSLKIFDWILCAEYPDLMEIAKQRCLEDRRKGISRKVAGLQQTTREQRRGDA